MKCTQCGTEFEGVFCPVCGTRAQPAESAGGAGQSAAQTPQAGQAAQSTPPQIRKCPVCGAERGNTPFCAMCGHKFDEKARTEEPSPFSEYAAAKPQGAPSAESAPQPNAGAGQGAPVYVQTVSVQAVRPPDPAPRPQKNALVRPWVNSWGSMSAGLIGLTLFFFLIAFSLVVPLHPTGRDILYTLLAIVVCVVLAIAIPSLISHRGKWGTRAYKSFLKYMRQNKKSNVDLADLRKKFRVSLLWRRGGEDVICVFALLVTVFFAAVFVGLLVSDSLSVLAILSWSLLFLLLVFVVVKLFLPRHKGNKEVKLAYYGKEKLSKGDKPIVTYGQVEQALRAYQTEWENYMLYKAKVRSYERGAVFTASSASRLLWLRVIGLRILAFVLSAALIVLVGVFACNSVADIFRTDKFALAEIGMTEQEIRGVFGSPYKEEPTGTYRYYSQPYRGLLEQSENFDPDSIQNSDDLTSAFLEAAQLAERMRTTSYSYIEVSFGEGGAVSLLFELSRTEEKSEISDVWERTVVSATIEQGAATGTAVVDTQYTGVGGGALWKARLEGALAEGTTETVGETVTLTCYDPYMQQNFTVQAVVIEAAEEEW